MKKLILTVLAVCMISISFASNKPTNGASGHSGLVAYNGMNNTSIHKNTYIKPTPSINNNNLAGHNNSNSNLTLASVYLK